MPKIYTIGHSNHLFSPFNEILKDKGITMVVDIRTNPYSKYSPHFNKKHLKKALEETNIKYIYLGKEIGGKPKVKKFYHQDKVLYHLLEKEESYQEGIAKLGNLAKDNVVVLMCSEENPYQCHRHLLITPTLLKKGYHISHIRKNGEIEDVKDRDVQTTLF